MLIKIEEVKVVVNGAGAAAIACTKLYIEMGLRKENVLMCDSKGVINHKRTNLTPEKLDFIVETDIETLEDAVKGSDVFIGLSKGNVMSPEMLLSMKENPIVLLWLTQLLKSIIIWHRKLVRMLLWQPEEVIFLIR